VALAAIFRKYPQTIDQALARIRAKSPASTALIDALGSASSAQSQAALAELLRSDQLNPDLRQQVLLSLSRTPRPDQTSVDALKMTLANEPFDEQALYGLGTYSRRLRDRGDAQGASEIGEFLLSRFPLVQGPSQLLTLLGAIANSGYAPALPKLSPFLSHERERVRAAAVHALQSIDDPEADNILATQLESDASSEVRVSAIEAAKVREPTDVLAHALTDAATHASDAQVRYRAVETIAVWMRKRMELRSTLEQVAQKDPEERVRNQARAAL
jgi:HEAT repeat protein